MREHKVTIDAHLPFPSSLQQVMEKAICKTLEKENIPFLCEVETVIVGDEEIQSINAQQRNIDKITDVLSFPMYEDVEAEGQAEIDSEYVFLGSMVLCFSQAQRQAAEYGHSIERETAFLTVHSVLHLIGYDHEQDDESRQIMFEKQEQILQDMGLTRND